MDNRYILFVAMTRPAINKWGIPTHAFSYIVGGTCLFGMWAGKGAGLWQILWFVIPGAILFGVTLALTEWDHNFFRILKLWYRTKAKGIGKPGGSVLSPLPAGIPSNPKDLAGAV